MQTPLWVLTHWASKAVIVAQASFLKISSASWKWSLVKFSSDTTLLQSVLRKQSLLTLSAHWQKTSMVQNICPSLKSQKAQTQAVLSSTSVAEHLQSVSTLDSWSDMKAMQNWASTHTMVSSSASMAKNTLLTATEHTSWCQATSMHSSNMQTAHGQVTDTASTQTAQHSQRHSVNLQWQKWATSDNAMH